MHSESLSKISGLVGTEGASSTIFSCRGACIDENLRRLRGLLCADKVAQKKIVSSPCAVSLMDLYVIRLIIACVESKEN